jgi:DNA-binding MarR family transcriptional regulator
MLDKSSNASRLVDKLLVKGLVEKSACKNDNRKMQVNITAEGLALLEKASFEVEQCISEVFGVLSVEEATVLNATLDKIRGG